MRIYYFDTGTGIYQGESYEEEKQVNCIEGATTIAPPAYEKGQVPVYDPRTRCWDVKPKEILVMRTAQAGMGARIEG
jgi:hypothetical protein